MSVNSRENKELLWQLLSDHPFQKKDPKKLKSEIAEFKKDFQNIKYCFQSSNQAYEYLKFY